MTFAGNLHSAMSCSKRAKKKTADTTTSQECLLVETMKRVRCLAEVSGMKGSHYDDM